MAVYLKFPVKLLSVGLSKGITVKKMLNKEFNTLFIYRNPCWEQGTLCSNQLYFIYLFLIYIEYFLTNGLVREIR